MSKNLFREEVASIKPYIPGKSVDELKKELGLEDIEKLASNENPLGPSPKAIEEIKKELDSIHIYPDSNCTKLKDKLCEKYNLKHENIVVGNGREELLKIIAQTFINEGDEAIMAKPTFGKYASEITKAMNKMKMVFHVNRLAQAAGIGALNDDDHINKTVELNYECMSKMEKYFEENDMEYIKSNSNFIFVNTGVDSKVVFEKLLKKGILVRPGYFWELKTWLRVSIGTKEQTEKFIDALQKVL